MTLSVTTISEAKTALDYFNGFHDGFIKGLNLKSHDAFEARGVQAKTRRLELRLTFAHYNYQQDKKPAGQLVTATFYEVTGFRADFSGLLHEWSIHELFISEAQRTLEDGRLEPCLRATLLQSRLSGQAWRRSEDLSFSFARAEFKELDS